MAQHISIAHQTAAAFQRGAIVLTSNQRSARLLATGTEFVGEVLPWTAWITRTWQQRIITGVEERILLQPHQEHLVWQNALAQVSPDLDSFALAEMAGDALALAARWRLTDRLPQAHIESNGDVRIFLRAYSIVQRRCLANGWLLSSLAEGELANTVRQSTMPCPSEIFLVGFDHLTPSQRDLLDAIQEKGCAIHHAIPLHTDSKVLTARCVDAEDEVRRCAQWASLCLEQGISKIAIIVPQPDEIRPELERAMRESISSEQHAIHAPAHALYEFSLGRPLASFAMVRHAFLLLQWLFESLPLRQASEVLRSVYVGPYDSLLKRAEFDLHVFRKEKHLTTNLRLESMSQLLLQSPDETLQTFANVLQDAHTRATQQTTRLPWQDWANQFAILLKTAGWPGTRPQTSFEFQLQNRWGDLLDEFASLQFSGEQVDVASALKMLKRLASSMLFAPQSQDAPVQILGPLEAAGSEFDALWFLQADDAHWPPSASSHPLLPYHLQKEFHLPGADLHTSMEVARATTNRILHSAPLVVASYASQNEHGLAIRQSSLFPPSAEDVFLPDPVARNVIPLEAEDDSDALPALPPSRLGGGATVLELQAACPFRAFAEKRLFAVQPEDRDDGLNAMERGSILHDVLSGFWREVKTQTKLRELSTATVERGTARDAVLRKQISRAMPSPRTSWEAAYLKIEAERVYRLLSLWLDQELLRPPFTVEATEVKVADAKVGPLSFQLRIDRVDAVDTPDGPARLLIDYKTSTKAKPSQWNGIRPDAPQLPLYAVAGGMDPVCGVAFASIFSGEGGMELNGISTPRELIKNPKLAPTIDESIEQWRAALQVLAKQFAEGIPLVDPKRYPATCQYCEQRLLCRIAKDEAEENQEESQG